MGQELLKGTGKLEAGPGLAPRMAAAQLEPFPLTSVDSQKWPVLRSLEGRERKKSGGGGGMGKGSLD